MQNTLRNVIAVIAGIVLGSVVNMGIISISGHIIAPPLGADVTSTEGLRNSLHLFEPKHFIFPFLAHAIGTFVGALVAAILSNTHKVTVAYIVGGFFLCGGIASIFMLPSPIWYTLVDLVFAYIPMAYIASKLSLKKQQ